MPIQRFVVVRMVRVRSVSQFETSEAEASKDYAPFTSAQFEQALKPLGDTPTIIVLSACHSGSFIPRLERNNRIILVAASAERASFGCSFEDENTLVHQRAVRAAVRRLQVPGRADGPGPGHGQRPGDADDVSGLRTAKSESAPRRAGWPSGRCAAGGNRDCLRQKTAVW